MCIYANRFTKIAVLATNYLSKCGLAVNASKCMTVVLKNVPHEKKTIVDKDTVFFCANKVLPPLKGTDEWRYLGIPFTPEGRFKLDIYLGCRLHWRSSPKHH